MGLWTKLLKKQGSQYSDVDKVALTAVQEITGYHFRNLDLLLLALTHRSFYKPTDKQHARESNERLEYLGDSVLGLVVADLLYKDHPDLREGRLTKMKAMLVNEITLASIGKKYKLNEQLRISPEEDKLGGRLRASIISDAVESIIGAIYLDGGLPAAFDVITRLIYANKQEILSDKSQKNHKGELLELMQSRGEGMPYYEVESETGPDHDKQFTVLVTVNSNKIGSGSGHTKKEAEQKAAAMALELVRSQGKSS